MSKRPKASKVAKSVAKAITDPQDMFTDMVKRAGEPLASVVRSRGGKPLRVATMCSGTEAPMIALTHIKKAILEVHGLSLNVEHVFSCEIEPFKQAYIEANFQPAKLFRDIRELPEGVATTAYGNRVDVPRNVDILVAGTSCVDNSTLR